MTDQISLINSSKSAQEAFGRFVEIMHSYGYDKVAYGFATDSPSLGLQKMHGHLNNFPGDWMKHYAQNQLAKIDPVPAHLLRSARPAFWSEFDADENLPEASRQLMRDAADAGLKNGVIVPLYGVGGEIAGMSLSRSVADDESYETLAAVNLLSVYFHETYKSFIKKMDLVELTVHEREVLSWAAEGKTDFEIASIISKSPATVRYHWNNIFTKLNAYGRVYAVSKAVQMRLVSPATF